MSLRAPSRNPLLLAMLAALAASPVAKADASAPVGTSSPKTLDEVTVTASPLRTTAEDIAKPVEILRDEALDRQKSATLGETLSALPGVQGASFGTAVSRPILRGLDGPRVQMLSGGLATMDVSTVSADHGVSVEPFLADQIEVLKGPATLLFGSGAIGGAVNVVDGRIASELPDAPLSGRAEVRGNTVDNEHTGLFRLDGVSGNWALHFDGLVRNTDDVDIPGVARLEAHEDGDHHDHDEEEQVTGTLPNSAIKTRAGAVGATWFGENAWFGIVGSSYRNNYGIPDGAHTHEEGHDHDHDHGDEDEHEEGSVRIDLVQNRWDVRGGLYAPFSFLERLDVKLAWNDYTHTEWEGDDVGTVFDNRGIEGRIEAVQTAVNGWEGAFGLQFADNDFRADGEEAFVPPTTTRTLGLFMLQRKDFDPLTLELGARYDHVALDPDATASRSFGLVNLSADLIWKLNDTFDLRLGLDRSERAPVNEELFAAGEHVATRSFEIGDATLDTEKANRVELGLHAHTDRLTFKAAVYQTRFSDFIYLADTGEQMHGTDVRLWTQQDARFTGAEAEATVHLMDNAAGALDLRLFGDTVRGKLDGTGTRSVAFDVPHGNHSHHYSVELDNAGNLPRIAPSRFGASLAWNRGGMSGSLGAVRYDKQDKVARNEEPSPGYTLLDAHLAYRWDRPAASWEVFLDGTNLSDQEARQHTSLLRDYAPLPGRAVAFGLRAWF